MKKAWGSSSARTRRKMSGPRAVNSVARVPSSHGGSRRFDSYRAHSSKPLIIDGLACSIDPSHSPD